MTAGGKRRRNNVACVCCATQGTEAARGLIWPCYKRHQRAGTLDKFKRYYEVQIDHHDTVVPLEVLGALLAAAPHLEEWVEERLGSDVIARAINFAGETSPLLPPDTPHHVEENARNDTG